LNTNAWQVCPASSCLTQGATNRRFKNPPFGEVLNARFGEIRCVAEIRMPHLPALFEVSCTCFRRNGKRPFCPLTDDQAVKMLQDVRMAGMRKLQRSVQTVGGRRLWAVHVANSGQE